jgi:hypothetical protein
MKCEKQIDERLEIFNMIKKLEENNTIVQILKRNINNTLMKFSGHKVIGSSSSEEESDSGSGSSIEIEMNRLDVLISKAEKIK